MKRSENEFLALMKVMGLCDKSNLPWLRGTNIRARFVYGPKEHDETKLYMALLKNGDVWEWNPKKLKWGPVEE